MTAPWDDRTETVWNGGDNPTRASGGSIPDGLVFCAVCYAVSCTEIVQATGTLLFERSSCLCNTRASYKGKPSDSGTTEQGGFGPRCRRRSGSPPYRVPSTGAPAHPPSRRSLRGLPALMDPILPRDGWTCDRVDCVGPVGIRKCMREGCQEATGQPCPARHRLSGADQVRQNVDNSL